jgi:hypothetical protein
MTEPVWHNLLKAALETEEDEIDCQQCNDLLDEYTDLLVAGAAPCQVMYQVKQHLNHCPDCAGVFECLLTIMDSGDQPWPCKPSL